MGSVKIVKASAGSGKTYALAYEYIRNVVADPACYRHTLAVTFTNKATEEMKRRILGELNALARGEATGYLRSLTADLGMTPEQVRAGALAARSRILHDYSRFAVLTIDKFFQRVVRAFIRELGIDLNFNLELQTESLLGKAADMLIEQIAADEPLRRWVTGFVEERIGENRRWDIRAELGELGAEIFRERFRRAGRSHIAREDLAAIVAAAVAGAAEVTETMKATAREALDIMARAGLSPSDFSGGNRSFANYFVKTAAGALADYGVSVSTALERDEKWYAKTSPLRDEIIPLIPVLREKLASICATWDANRARLNSVEIVRRNYRNFALLDDLAANVERICANENIVPISRTNDIVHRLVAGNDAPFIFEKAGNHFTRFMIDEFQDTSAVQWENFLPLLRNAVSQAEGSAVLLVGDVKQSIYRWRGGDWKILASAVAEGFDEVEVAALDTNYRSRGGVVRFNNAMIGACVARDNAALNTALDEAAAEHMIDSELQQELHDTLATAYDGHSQKSPDGRDGGYVSVTVYGEPDTGAEDGGPALPPVVERIEELQRRGFRPCDIAVLVRTGAEGVRVAQMLLDHKAANPGSPYSYDVVTQEALQIGSSPVVRFIVACFRAGAPGDDGVSLAVWNRWLDNPPAAPPGDDEAAFLGALRLMPPEEALEAVIRRYGLDRRESDAAWLQGFQDQVIAFSRSRISDLDLFVRWWDEQGAGQSLNLPLSERAVTISTIHKAKGLQYRAVIIPWCNWPLTPLNRTVLWAGGFNPLESLPVRFSERMRDSQFAADYYRELVLSHVDNLNILYVALTRAEEELHIMMPHDRRRRENRVNTLLLDSIGSGGEGDSTAVGDLRGEVVRNGDTTEFRFGEPVHAAAAGQDSGRGTLRLPYRSFDSTMKLRLRFPSERYAGEDGGALSPRDMGVAMHRALETAATMDDVARNIERMTADRILSPDRAAQLREGIARALDNPVAGSWFGDGWTLVRNENNIIVPGAEGGQRPDRVMIRGERAVVVDYKFGVTRPARHRRQIERYMELLRAMGYARVEGYIWYFSLGDIEQV